jgi:MFS family permease
MAPASKPSPSIIDSNINNDLESAHLLPLTVPTPAPKPVTPWNQIVAFVLALACCACANSICLFSMFSPGFQHNLGYSPVQINTISIASSLGMYLPVPALGYVADKLGPGNLGIISIVLFTPPYFIAAYISQMAPAAAAANFHLLALCFASIGAATSALYFSGVLTCAKMMPRSPGLAISAPIACFGLSSLWQSQLIQLYFFDAEGNIMLSPTFRFFAGLYLLAGITSYVGASVIGKVHGSNLVAIEPEVAPAETHQKLPLASQNGNYGTTPNEPQATAELPAEVDDEQWLLYKRHETITQFLMDRTVWVFYIAFILISGPLEMYINNMGMILSTIPTGAPSVTTNVSLFSAFSTISRLLMGVLSDYVRNRVSRQIILVGILLFFALINFLMASGVFTVLKNGAYFPFSSSSVGFSYGSVYTLVPTIVACTWGVENLGVHWGIFITAPAIGSTGYGYLFAKVFEAASSTIDMVASDKSDAPTQCLGRNCYDATFLTTGTSVTVAAILVMMVWLFAWKKHRL